MDSVVRSLWVVRAWSALSLMGFLWGFAAVDSAVLPLLLALLGAAVEALAVLGTVAMTRALLRGDQGEILMRNGARIPYGTLRAAYLADTAEMLVAVASAGALCADLLSRGSALFPMACLFGLLLVLVQVVLWMPRRWSHQMFEAVWTLTRFSGDLGELDRAERALRGMELSRVSTYQVAAARLRAQVLLRRGQPYAAEQLLERTWNGTLDDHAGLLAWIRLGAGNPALAERWLAAQPPQSHRYARYLAALVGGTLALHQGRPAEALARVRAVPRGLLPEWYETQLGLIELAAIRAAGLQEELPAAQARTGPLEPHAWLASVQPSLWSQLSAERPSGTLAQPQGGPGLDPFAPPTSPLQPRSRSSRLAGAVPIEGLALGQARTGALALVRFVLGGMLLVLGGLLALLLGLLGRLDPSAELGKGIEPLLAITIPWLGLAVMVEQLVGLVQPRTGAQVVLSDGRFIAHRGFVLWATAVVLPQLGGALFALMAPVLLVSASGLGSLWGTLLISPLALLLSWTVFLRLQSLRLVARLHFDPPEQVLPRVRAIARPWLRHTGQATVATALAALWSGDPAEAERAERDLEELAAAQALPQATQVLGWFHAARGRLDLERALREPDPEALGDRYRWSVALCLAALQSGQPERLRERVSDFESLADALPNRFGTLLRHLARRVRGDRSPADTDLAWLGTVWPFAA